MTAEATAELLSLMAPYLTDELAKEMKELMSDMSPRQRQILEDARKGKEAMQPLLDFIHYCNVFDRRQAEEAELFRKKAEDLNRRIQALLDSDSDADSDADTDEELDELEVETEDDEQEREEMEALHENDIPDLRRGTSPCPDDPM